MGYNERTLARNTEMVVTKYSSINNGGLLPHVYTDALRPLVDYKSKR